MKLAAERIDDVAAMQRRKLYSWLCFACSAILVLVVVLII